jgi:hypothetical protein
MDIFNVHLKYALEFRMFLSRKLYTWKMRKGDKYPTGASDAHFPCVVQLVQLYQRTAVREDENA